MRRFFLRALAAALLFGLPACGGGSQWDAWGGSDAPGGMAPAQAMSGSSMAESEPMASNFRSDVDSTTRGHSGNAGGGNRGAQEQERYAQAEVGPADPPTATDARSSPLLVYTAEIGLAVHQVAAKQQRIEDLAREVGGHLDRRTGNQIRIRVPAAQFQVVLDAILELGDVLNRDVQVQDVTEEFNDVQIRIRTLEAMYQRVQRLLEEADNVERALAVEQHLERITIELETMRGRLRFLADRVAFSTITVTFQERTTVSEPTFELPFPWLRSLGLQGLMRLR